MGAGISSERTQGPRGQQYSEGEASMFNEAMRPKNKGLDLIRIELELGADPDRFTHHLVSTHGHLQVIPFARAF